MMRIFWSSSEARLRAGWRLAAQLTANLGLAILVWWALRRAAGGLLQAAAWSELARYAVLFAVTLLTVAAAARWLDRRPLADLGLHPAARVWWADFAFGTVLAIVPIAALALLAWACGWVTIRAAFVSGLVGVALGPALVVALAQYLFVAFFEELARAYQIRNLWEGTRGRLGPIGGAVLAAVGATLVSVVMHAGPPLFLLFVFLDMAMYALCYLLTGRIAIATGHHLVWDLLLSTVLVVEGVLPLNWAAALFFVEPAEAALSVLAAPRPGIIVLAIAAILAYEAVNVLLVWGWVRWRGGRPFIQGREVLPGAEAQRALRDPRLLSPRDVLRLQRTAGNRAVGRLLSGARPRPTLQAKLTVGPAADAYEEEADRAAEQVMPAPAPPAPGAQRAPRIQRLWTGAQLGEAVQIAGKEGNPHARGSPGHPRVELGQEVRAGEDGLSRCPSPPGRDRRPADGPGYRGAGVCR